MIVISNGFWKFHLSVAAAEADRRGTLSGFITGAYPNAAIRKILDAPILRSNPKAMQLKGRQEQIADKRVHALFSPEALFVLGAAFHSNAVPVDALMLYGHFAKKYVERTAADGARIYHYRAGFGGQSVQIAKRLGMVALCDHSIAHPAVIDTLVNNMGRLPSQQEQMKMSLFNEYILHDIEQADVVLVNSQFVKDTFVHMGAVRAPIHVIYLGVDDSFLIRIPERTVRSGEPRLLFAGLFEKRKGAETLIEALGYLNDLPWQLEIAGGLDSASVKGNRSFFANPRVNHLGLLSRPQLASAMSRADIFVFPSLAEGSARVVFEALASGCYVITTPNAGSIVEDGIHGRVVPPGDAAALAAAIRSAITNPALVTDVGLRNAELVREKYRQSHYGDNLANLYTELLAEKSALMPEFST